MSVRIFSGNININEANGNVSPYEKFIITFNPDGTKLLKTLSISPDGDLIRDVNQYFSKQWFDIEGVARLFYKNEYLGTIIRRIIDGRLYSTIWKGKTKSDYTEFKISKNIHLGFHSLTNDSWKMNFLDTSHKNEQEINIHTISHTWNGSTITHGKELKSSATYEGWENLQLTAGKFECQRFLWKTPSNKLLKIWRMGEARVLAKMEVVVGKNKGAIYELSNYKEELIG
mgnify:CR=1 FL=1